MGGYATNPDTNSASEITGSGTANYMAKFTGAQTIGNSTVTDDGTYVMFGTNLLSSRASDGRLVLNYPQASLAASFGHTLASPYSGAGANAFTVGTSGLTSSLFTIANNGAFAIGYLSGPTASFSGDGVNNYIFTGSSAQKVGINTTPSALLHVLGITEQIRGGYDASNYLSVTVAPTGSTTFALTGTSPIFTFSQAVTASVSLTTAQLILSGNISQAAWTTSGLRIKNVASTFTDTTSSGTVAVAYTDALGGNTIAASSATTYTDYYATFISGPTAGTNVTMTNKWVLGLLSGTATTKIGNLIGTTDRPAIYFATAAPSGTNYALSTTTASGVLTMLNGSSGIRIRANNADMIQVNATDMVFLAPASSGGTTTTFTFTNPANLNQTLSSEIPSVKHNSGSRQWATGAITTQREFYVTTATYSFVGASTITNAYGMYVEAPTAGTNATITNNWALGLSGSVVMVTGRIVGKQGAAVASANNLVLGTDGNVFEITGTTQINLISNLGWQDGAQVTLAFTATPTVKNGQATSSTNIQILLAGAADFVASANDTLTLVLCTVGGTQTWKEISRAVI